MDEKDVPENDRVAIVKPEEYYKLVQTTDVINRDWGGSGVYADGTVLRVAGVQIVKSNNLPTTNIASATSGTNNTYHGDFTNVKALVMQKSAIGTVKLMDLAVEQTSGDFEIMYQGTLMAAKYAMGHGILVLIVQSKLKRQHNLLWVSPLGWPFFIFEDSIGADQQPIAHMQTAQPTGPMEKQ